MPLEFLSCDDMVAWFRAVNLDEAASGEPSALELDVDPAPAIFGGGVCAAWGGDTVISELT